MQHVYKGFRLKSGKILNIELCQLCSFSWSIPLTFVYACVFSLQLWLKFLLRVQSNNQPQTDRQVIQQQWQFLFVFLFLIISPTTTLCPSVSCSPLPLWLSLSLHILCIFMSLSASAPTAKLLINSSTSSTFTAVRDRQREGEKGGMKRVDY